MNNSGFYKKEDNDLLYAPTAVDSLLYSLVAEFHDQYDYPVDGWYWFDDEDSARVFFDLPAPEPEPDPNAPPI